MEHIEITYRTPRKQTVTIDRYFYENMEAMQQLMDVLKMEKEFLNDLIGVRRPCKLCGVDRCQGGCYCG